MVQGSLQIFGSQFESFIWISEGTSEKCSKKKFFLIWTNKYIIFNYFIVFKHEFTKLFGGKKFCREKRQGR